MKNIFLKTIRKLILFFRYSPYNISVKIRYILYKFLMIKIGHRCNILDSVYISNPENISLGNRVSIHQFCYFDALNEIEIGNDVAIGSHVKIITSEHIFSDNDILIKDQGIKSEKITINDNVWLGTGVTILKGITIGKNSIIGAQSLVNKDIPADVIAAGVPCKIIRKR